MILQELTLENIGVFKGIQSLDFTTNGSKQPITLVGALNGSGKTTILQALQLALFGNKTKNVLPRSMSYKNYIRSRIINEDIKANIGRFGPYVTAGKGKNGTIPPTMSPLTIELVEALELISKRNSGPQELRILGDHTETGESLVIKSGRYGPYITDGKVNASLPQDADPEKITLEEGVVLIDKKRAAPPRKKRRKSNKKKMK